MVNTEPLSGAAEARHHLVGDENDAVAVADIAHPGHIAGRWDHDARGAWHRFQDQRREGRRALVGDEAFEVVQRTLGFLLFVVGIKRRTVEEWSIEVHDATAGVIVGVAPRVTGEVDRRVGPAVIGAVAREHLVAAGV